jgi:hypothetical protein
MWLHIIGLNSCTPNYEHDALQGGAGVNRNVPTYHHCYSTVVNNGWRVASHDADHPFRTYIHLHLYRTTQCLRWGSQLSLKL